MSYDPQSNPKVGDTYIAIMGSQANMGKIDELRVYDSTDIAQIPDWTAEPGA